MKNTVFAAIALSLTLVACSSEEGNNPSSDVAPIDAEISAGVEKEANIIYVRCFDSASLGKGRECVEGSLENIPPGVREQVAARLPESLYRTTNQP